jgi:polyisoprenoid-binding protein YceI
MSFPIVSSSFKNIISEKISTDLEGDLTIHGVTKKIKTKITFASNTGKITATSNLIVKAKDYGIEIPSLVKSKIAEDIKVGINLMLEAK